MISRVIGLGLTVAMLAANAGAATQPPAETPDGLQLVPDTAFGLVYAEPGIDLTGYTELGLVPCQVSFKKNWMKDQNRNALDLSSRVTQRDIEKIKTKLAAECDKQFRNSLTAPPPYTLVESFTKGEAVLIVRPSIVNLDITAPDLKSAGRERTYTTGGAGEMTIVLELLDGTTGDVLVRGYDREGGRDTSPMQWSNSVTNRAEAERILKLWSERLRKGLDEAIKQHSG